MNTARQEALDRVATSTYYRLVRMPEPAKSADGTRQKLLLAVGRFYQQIELLEGEVKIYSDFYPNTSTRDRIILDAEYLDMKAPVEVPGRHLVEREQSEWRRWWMSISNPTFQKPPGMHTYLKLFDATDYILHHSGVRWMVVVMTAKVAPKKGLNLWVARTRLPYVYQVGGPRYFSDSSGSSLNDWGHAWSSRIIEALMLTACAEAPELAEHLPDLSEIDN